jgi:hypothetical protein
VTPIARITQETPGHRRSREFADQDREGPCRRGENRCRQGDIRRRIGRRRRSHHGGVVCRRRGRGRAKANYIPFSGGGESLAAILGGKVTAGISGVAEYEGQIKAGKLRAIGVTTPERIPGLDIPTFKEQGIDLVITNWRSSWRPPASPRSRRKALTDLVTKMVQSRHGKTSSSRKGWDDAFLPATRSRNSSRTSRRASTTC